MGKLRKACANCIKYKLACETKRPCSRCVLHQCSCIDVERKPRAARKPKRPRLDVPAESAAPCCPQDAIGQHTHTSPVITSSPPKAVTNSQGSIPFVPDLVLNDNDPLFSTNINENPFMMQSTEASLLPFNDANFLLNNTNSYLSNVLLFDHEQASLIPPKVELSASGNHLFTEDVRKSDLKQTQTFYNPNSAQSFVQAQPMNPTNKFVIPVPQPLVVVNKTEWSVVDCNIEFAQFLGYNTITEFNASVNALSSIVAPESIGLSKQNFDYFLNAKVNHFERLAVLKSKDGSDRTVTLHVDIMEKLMMFTIKEVFDMRPMCFYTKWLKAVAPNAITPCDRMRCPCRMYDFMMNAQQQQIPTL